MFIYFFPSLLWSKAIRCFHIIAFLRNYVFIFFPRSTCFDRLRQVSTSFDRRRAHPSPALFSRPFFPRKFVSQKYATSLCIHIFFFFRLLLYFYLRSSNFIDFTCIYLKIVVFFCTDYYLIIRSILVEKAGKIQHGRHCTSWKRRLIFCRCIVCIYSLFIRSSLYGISLWFIIT